MILDLIVFVAMFIQDTSGASKINFLDRGKPWKAGVAEAVNDWGGALSYGVGGYSVAKYGICLQSAGIMLSLGLAAVTGTVFGDWLTRRNRDQEKA